MKTVLVGVLKSRADLTILLKEKWYRIPLRFLPKRLFTHIAFYQPLSLGRKGKRIEYYARVAKREIKKRIELLPRESLHLRAYHDYLKCSFRKVEKLERPIRNTIPRRVSFGFTDLKTLRSAKDILELYHVAPTEQIIEQELQRRNISVTSQYRLSLNSSFPKGGGESSSRRIFRLDLAVFCKNGNLAIECDNRKAHASKRQKLWDTQKDTALKRSGWRVIRLTERDILEDLDTCISRIRTHIRSFGGTS
ncbi:MAG: hypothetical protein A2849_02660 [Candidatus Taylorbacteria bacterium RIFCSPHIGHO2_01_FULL_51_15]|uniref:Restriction endonuclease type II-like domain-containing protein n=1 Tax=Candidatus Taylorbacteria bacterium RIFCSPHIGHO2_01_FULL_51_15 TaxID=1802304 RepID=A0A1G2MF71_9BACT|nr:MAG: hypothetical protein A2849_02660 [Candidatus Taylorbacteria bacterium RIFCSPHIGHO2_01_FULL_51_15]